MCNKIIVSIFCTLIFTLMILFIMVVSHTVVMVTSGHGIIIWFYYFYAIPLGTCEKAKACGTDGFIFDNTGVVCH